ncbi:MAG: PASTA domain-containing protein, partial [Oscillospiraceae bacterium]|nr:PASTA domain-containing protein [Oscillospiraceae bacterium]
NIILSALGHAHEHGVIHRDLKPQNIMLTRDGQLKIMDFGIARLATANQRTVTDKAIGSVHYISPEQVRGQSTDGRSDIYSIGIMMYEMITGKLPFQSETAVSVALQQLSDKAQPVSELVPDVPKGFEHIIMKAIEKDPEKRYQTAAEMRRDIQQVRENPDMVFQNEEEEELEQTKTVMINKVPSDKKTNSKIKLKFKGNKKLLLPVIAGLATAFLISAVVGIYFIFKLSGNPLLTKQPDVELPSFVGMTESQAKADGDFKFEIEYVYNEDFEKGTVFSQTPKAPRTVKKNSTVKLRVSKGVMTSEMPNLKNFTRSEAEKVLGELGVNIAVEIEETKDVVSGSVVRTDPEQGSIVSSGSLVTIYIAVDPTLQNRTVPNVVGSENLSVARKAISAAGLRVGSYTMAESHDPEGTIIGQTPSAGEEVPAGSAVVLVVSSGKPKCPDCGSEEHTVHPTCGVCGSKDHTVHPSCGVCGSLEHTEHPTCSQCGEYSPNHKADCPTVKPSPTPTTAPTTAPTEAPTTQPETPPIESVSPPADDTTNTGGDGNTGTPTE